jgi:hypothetical protein
MASRILRTNQDTKPLGKQWIQQFLQRNPRVKSVIGEKIEVARCPEVQEEQIIAFLTLFNKVRNELGVLTENVWNMDETGIGLGICANTQVLASSKKRKANIKTP